MGYMIDEYMSMKFCCMEKKIVCFQFVLVYRFICEYSIYHSAFKMWSIEGSWMTINFKQAIQRYLTCIQDFLINSNSFDLVKHVCIYMCDYTFYLNLWLHVTIQSCVFINHNTRKLLDNRTADQFSNMRLILITIYCNKSQ